MIVTRPISSLPAGTNFSRYIQALAATKGNRGEARDLAAQWREVPLVNATFEAIAAWRTKGTVEALTSATAEPLVQTGLAQEFLELSKSVFVFDMLKARGLRRVPFNLQVARQIGTKSGGGWVGAGAAKPLRQLDFDNVRLTPFEAAVIVVISDELARTLSTSAEGATRAATLEGLAAFVDGQLLDPTVSGVPGGENPASITNGAPSVTSTGSTAAQIITDLSAMLQAIDTGGDRLVWVLRPLTYFTVVAKLAGVGLTVPPGTLLGIPVILSSNSPAQITLVDASEILYADEGAFDIDIARHATVQMDDDPTNAGEIGGSPSGPNATALVSLFQNDLVGIRASRWLSWERARDGSVVYMTVSY